MSGQEAADVNWLDAAPGVAMEYKVHVDAAKEDCYYQYVHPGATLYVSYQVCCIVILLIVIVVVKQFRDCRC